MNEYQKAAFMYWQLLAVSEEATTATDYCVNHLLVNVVGEHRYKRYDDMYDDPIYMLCGSLTSVECRRFVEGARSILRKSRRAKDESIYHKTGTWKI